MSTETGTPTNEFKIWTSAESRASVAAGSIGLIGGAVLIVSGSSDSLHPNHSTHNLRMAQHNIHSLQSDAAAIPSHDKRTAVEHFLKKEMTANNKQIAQAVKGQESQSVQLDAVGEMFGVASLLAFAGAAVISGIRYRMHNRKQSVKKEKQEESITAIVNKEFDNGFETLDNWRRRQDDNV